MVFASTALSVALLTVLVHHASQYDISNVKITLASHCFVYHMVLFGVRK